MPNPNANPATPANRPAIAPVMRLQAAANASEYELLIYGDIGESWWGESVTAKDVVEQLNALDASVATVNVRINSYGGSVADGLAIFNALRRHSARKVVTVDGVAMSSASLIAMAGDEVVMGDASLLMIHAPWGGLMGNAQEMRKYADILDTYAASMAGAYVAKSGKTRDDVLALLTDGVDHYYTAEQAVAEGFADRQVTAALDEPDEQSRAFASGLLQRYLTAAPAGVAQLAIAAALRNRGPAITPPAPPAAQPLSAAPVAVPSASPNPTGESSMPNTAQTPTPAPSADAQAAAIAVLAQRNEEINAALKDILDVPGIRDLQMKALSDPAMTVDAVKNRAMAILGAAAQPANGGGGRVEGGEDSRDKFIRGASRALETRAGLAPREAGNEFNGMTLTQIAAESLSRAGISVRGMSGDQIARRVLGAQTTSDFPHLVSNTAGKALRSAYELHPTTYQKWCHIGSVSDFKAHKRIQLGSFNSLATIAEGGEYTYGNVAEESESITAVTKGKALALTRQLIVNDDLGAFIRRAQMLGRAAARTVNNDVYALLTSGASNNGPTLADTGQLFNATAVTTTGGHANYLASGYAPTVASISAGRKAMRLQKDAGLRDTLNIQPRFLLAPITIEDAAWAVINSSSDPASSNSNKRNFIRDYAPLELITEPYLDGISTTAWYLLAGADEAPLIEVDFLDGNSVPFIDEAVDFDTDAMKYKVRLDYGVAAIDFRGGYRTTGTGGS